MTHLTKVRFIALVLVFAFCQIIGAMCVLPDVSLANDMAQLAEGMNDMACPMNGTSMCPLSATSSPERQFKHAAAIDFDQAPLLPSTVTIVTTVAIPTAWSWSSVLSIVPISIASPSVLRI